MQYAKDNFMWDKLQPVEDKLQPSEIRLNAK